MKTIELLKELTDSFGVSGHEEETFKTIEKILRENYKNLTYERKGTGSLLVKMGNGSKKVAFFAHTDEIGLVISKITDSNYARVAGVGGVDPRTLLAKRVIFRTASGNKLGIIGMLAPHLQAPSTKDKSPSFDQIFVDFSVSGGTKDLQVGDMGTLEVFAAEMQGDKLTSKALDNRAGVAALMRSIDYLSDLKFDGQLVLCFNKGEEIGLIGAKGMSYEVNPDYAIVVDVTFASENNPNFETYKLGDGPVVAVGAPITPSVFEQISSLAQENNIQYQIEAVPGSSGTEADVVQLARNGIKTGLISIPLLNMHSPVETVSIQDIDNTARLLAIFASKAGR